MKVILDKRAFTKHGQHMKAMGKQLMAKRIVEAIKDILKVCKKHQSSQNRKKIQTKTIKAQGKLKMELGKEETPQKTRMIVFKQKIITADNKKRRQW